MHKLWMYAQEDNLRRKSNRAFYVWNSQRHSSRHFSIDPDLSELWLYWLLKKTILLKGTQMTPDQIAQLRTILKEVLDNFPQANYIEDCKSIRLLEQALALLPCETCNGTEIQKPKDGCGDCLAGDGNCFADCPCPDCQ